MLRRILGFDPEPEPEPEPEPAQEPAQKQEQEPSTAMASEITISEFKDALSRYPAVLKARNANAKADATPIEELDRYRYVEAPARFSKNTGRTIKLEDVKKLLEWKLRHGKSRPSLPAQVASNTDDLVEEATKDAFAHYAKEPDEIKNVIGKLTTPLKGIGPATASLLLAVHDPDNVVFFSDEAHRWLVTDSEKATIKYNVDEYAALYRKAKDMQAKLKVTPIDIEKVAFVIIKETEPIIEKKVPSGKGRGRPPLPEDMKKPKKEVVASGRGRGRPPKDPSAPKAVPKARTPKSPKAKAKAKADTNGEAKAPGKRGRPAKKAEVENDVDDDDEEEEKDADEEEEDEVSTPAPTSAKKRKADGTPKRSGKKAKS